MSFFTKGLRKIMEKVYPPPPIRHLDLNKLFQQALESDEVEAILEERGIEGDFIDIYNWSFEGRKLKLWIDGTINIQLGAA